MTTGQGPGSRVTAALEPGAAACLHKTALQTLVREAM